MRVLVGTTNPGKQKEFSELLRTFSLDFQFLETTDDVEEYGSSLAQNAHIKAVAYANPHPSFDFTLTDDSGLLVDALHGFPGVASNRWHEGSDKDRNIALLEKLAAEHISHAQAKFQTVLCFYNNSSRFATFFTGTIPGRIAQHSAGEFGFGYDSIFIPQGYSETFAQLGPDVKNEISHRSRALKQFASYLSSTL